MDCSELGAFKKHDLGTILGTRMTRMPMILFKAGDRLGLCFKYQLL